MAVVWLGLGVCVGVAVGWLIRAAVDPALDAENRELRGAIARIRSALLLGNLRYAKRECDLVLGDEAA